MIVLAKKVNCQDCEQIGCIIIMEFTNIILRYFEKNFEAGPQPRLVLTPAGRQYLWKSYFYRNLYGGNEWSFFLITYGAYDLASCDSSDWEASAWNSPLTDVIEVLESRKSVF